MHAPTLSRLASLAVVSPDEEWNQIRDRLEECLVSGTAPSTCHLLLADGYLRRDEPGKARVHLDLAQQIDARSIIVMNNLAWVVAFFMKPADLPRAEKLIDHAIQLATSKTDSQHLELRETRGQVKLRLKKYQDAIQDLELVLEKYTDRDTVRLALAEAYEAQGDRERAAAQRRRVQEKAARKEAETAATN
jgi:tetratricopeptide (TPR) repeat protein